MVSRLLQKGAESDVRVAVANSETYLWQIRVLRINHDPADLNDLCAILSDVDAVFIASRGNVNDAKFLKVVARRSSAVLTLMVLWWTSNLGWVAAGRVGLSLDGCRHVCLDEVVLCFTVCPKRPTPSEMLDLVVDSAIDPSGRRECMRG